MDRSSSTPGAVPLDVACNVLFAEARTETVNMADINEFFICKICKGYLRDPYTIKECLHTFCHGCINRFYLYDKSTSCPTCSISLGAKPLAKTIPDPAMKELAEKLLPDYTAKEDAEELTFYTKLGVKRKQPDTPREPEQRSSRSKRSLGPGNMIQFEMYSQHDPDVPLFLQLEPLETPCMRTQALLKIMHLRKFLAHRLKVAKPEEIEILCKGVTVGPEYSLEFIRRTRWEEDTKMVLEYRRQLIAG